jgi:hypothetical protein
MDNKGVGPPCTSRLLVQSYPCPFPNAPCENIFSSSQPHLLHICSNFSKHQEKYLQAVIRFLSLEEYGISTTS